MKNTNIAHHKIWDPPQHRKLRFYSPHHHIKKASTRQIPMPPSFNRRTFSLVCVKNILFPFNADCFVVMALRIIAGLPQLFCQPWKQFPSRSCTTNGKAWLSGKRAGKSGDLKLESYSYHQLLVPGLTFLLCSQLVCLLPVGICYCLFSWSTSARRYRLLIYQSNKVLLLLLLLLVVVVVVVVVQ